MSKKDKITSSTQQAASSATQLPTNPNALVHQFLRDNNLRMRITAIDPTENGFIQTGFIIEDRPILQVVFEHNA